jgi:hypothetical protein
MLQVVAEREPKPFTPLSVLMPNLPKTERLNGDVCTGDVSTHRSQVRNPKQFPPPVL